MEKWPICDWMISTGSLEPLRLWEKAEDRMNYPYLVTLGRRLLITYATDARITGVGMYSSVPLRPMAR